MKVLVLPGASLMEVTLLNDGVRLRCPGCGTEQVYREGGSQEFVHEDACPVYSRIANAVARYEREVVKRG